MLLAWSSPELKLLCASRDGFMQVAPESAAAAQDLLSAIVHTPDLQTLRRLRSIRVRPIGPRRLGNATVSLELQEVHMNASVLTRTGERIRLTAISHFWERAGSAPALLIGDLAVGERSLVRAAS